MKLTKDFHDTLLQAELDTWMLGVNPNTSHPYTHKETSEILTHLAADAPHLLRQKIETLQRTVATLKSYLPNDAGRAALQEVHE